ncbi:MAG: hypothetical protein IKO68_13645 [Oscillospiraceae bacterium]|nr:hypothetical protein [Oscillospiraceae bacterium]
MKRAGAFIAGVLCGALFFGGSIAYAAGILAEPSSHRVYVDGSEVQLDTYLINGSNYVQLRDVGKIVNFNVYWDGSVQIESGHPYSGIAPAKDTFEDVAEVNPAVFTGAYTPEFYAALRSAILTGKSTEPVRLTEETYNAMIEAEAAIGSWPVYDLKSDAEGLYRIIARYPEPYAEAAAYCQPFIDSLADQSDREIVRKLAFFVCDRIEYDGSTYCSPRTALVSDEVQKGACMSYAYCFKFLCDLAEIPCILTHSEDHQWNLVYVEGRWWHVDVTSLDVSDTSWRPKLQVLDEDSDMQGSIYIQSQSWLTDIAKELLVPGSTLD